MRQSITFFLLLILLTMQSCTKDETNSSYTTNQEWKHHRGDNKNSGFTKGRLPANGFLSPLWEYDNGKDFLNNLVVSNNRVFITRDSLRILDLNTGKVLYRNKSISGCQPTLDANFMYLGNVDGSLIKFDYKINEIVWQKTLDHITCSTPIIESENILLTAEDYLYCISVNGDELWRAQIGATSNVNVAVNEGVCYIGNIDGEVFAINIQSGTILWKKTGLRSIKSIPIFAGNVLIIGAENGNLYGMNPNDGTIKWNFKANDKMRFNIGASDGKNVVYNAKSLAPAFTADSLYCISVSNGSIKWATESDDDFQQTVLIVNDKLLCHVEGKFSLVDINSGTKIWEYFSYIHDTPILFGDKMLINLGKSMILVKY
ncbi:MAG TPA: PQQ-like beta-propeller repeat protein [Saprospiraceae bacterium]|nr:PQQ-like beta-propeller repeat protein [Saprospiraceae bacterium]